MLPLPGKPDSIVDITYIMRRYKSAPESPPLVKNLLQTNTKLGIIGGMLQGIADLTEKILTFGFSGALCII